MGYSLCWGMGANTSTIRFGGGERGCQQLIPTVLMGRQIDVLFNLPQD